MGMSKIKYKENRYEYVCPKCGQKFVSIVERQLKYLILYHLISHLTDHQVDNLIDEVEKLVEKG